MESACWVQLSESEFNKLHSLGVAKKLLQTFSEFDNNHKSCMAKMRERNFVWSPERSYNGLPPSLMSVHHFCTFIISSSVNCLDNVRESIKNYDIPRV